MHKKDKKCVNCKKASANYGNKNGTKQYCRACRDKLNPDMINLKGYICKTEGCMTRAAYGYNITDRKNLYCGECSKKYPGMKNVLNKMCEDCGLIQPTYNYPAEKRGKYCNDCKLDGMVDVKGKKCIICKKRIALYGFQNDIRLYCSDCRVEGTKDLSKKYCENCKDIMACWALKGTTVAKYCYKCTQLTEGEYINLTRKFCKFPGCELSPCYGKNKNSKKEYCAEHGKQYGYVPTTKQLCIMCNEKGPSYGYSTDDKPKYCATCAPEGTKNIKSKKCDADNCDTVATWNFKGLRPIKCKKHALVNMIDVTAIYCRGTENEKCSTTAGFGYPGQKQEVCAKHKQDGMIVDPRKMCNVDKCKNPATHGKTVHIRCEIHAEPADYNLVEKECKTCKLIMILNKDDLCGFCDPSMIKNVRLAKQKEVKHMLDKYNYKYTIYDSIIDSYCGLERPDFVFDCNDHFIVLEVDENQHSDRNPECEKIRMINISQALGMKTSFIRYNPDSYKLNKKIIEPSNNLRHDKLRQIIDYLSNKKDLGFLTVTYLFYDNYDKNSLDIINLWKNGDNVPL